MSGMFGTAPAPWLTSGTLVYALDGRETANRFTARIEGGYEINYKRDPVRTSDAEIAATVRAIAQVPAMLELVERVLLTANNPSQDDALDDIENLARSARKIVAELEKK